MNQVLRRNLPFLGLMVIAVGLAGFIWFGLPHDREVQSLWIFVFKLLPFIFAAEAIARLDVELFKRVQAVRLLIPVCFMVFFLYFVPKIFFYMDDHPNLYYHVLTVTPFLILTFALSHRLGGGTPGNARRLAFGMLIIMVSGAEDLAFLTVNDLRGTDFHPIPEVWSWASHMEVRLGHPPTKNEAFIFIAVHLLIAAFVLFAPTRWFEKLNPWRKKAAATSAPNPPVETAANEAEPVAAKTAAKTEDS